MWPKATPRLRSTVLSVRSRWKREIGSFSLMCAKQRVGDAEVAFGVLEVDRVDLVRHRARADSRRRCLLREVAEADVAPGVARPVDQDRVAALDRVEQLGDRVVRLDLGRVGVELQAEPLLDDAAREAPPSRARDRRRRARCSCRPRRSSWRASRPRRSRRARRAQPHRDVGDLLAERRRASPSGRACARASAASACARAIAASVATMPSSAGSRTSRRAASSISAWLVLLMSSLVHAKWMKPAAPASVGSPAKRSPSQYSTALTSWLVRRSIALIASASASREVARPGGCRNSRAGSAGGGSSARPAPRGR